MLIGQRNTPQTHTEWSAAGGFVSQGIPFLGPPVLLSPSLSWDSDRARVVLSNLGEQDVGVVFPVIHPPR